MGNQREIRQVTPRSGLGVVIAARPGCGRQVCRLAGFLDERRDLYTFYVPSGEPVSICNLDGPEVILEPRACDNLVIYSGGKMWCGYDVFVDHI